ncbi:MAG: anaerobic sulfatase maturase [Chthonomonadales bacterium]|nr:anaerobic sulfatase maturase [Chthonomonadales bacterium]
MPQSPRAFHVMTKPIGPICNLDCKYCFYLEKETLYPGNRRWEMPDDVLERYVREYIEQQDVPDIHFAWQGGEPTLLGVRYFHRVVELQRRYAGGKRVHNALQTNGTLLDDQWGRFLHENRFLVGLSVDGPEDLHDAYRVDRRGRPSFADAMRGLDVLKRHHVEFNTLTVVNRLNARRPLDVYRFLKRIGSGFLQFIPLVERASSAPAVGGLRLAEPPHLDAPEPQGDEPAVTEWSVDARDYGEFLVTIFEEWVRKDVGRVFVQMFDVALGNWAGAGSSLCVFAETCGQGLAMEHNGDLYACDHYVYPEHRLGNVRDTSLGDMVASERQVRFGLDKRDTLPRQCRECSVRFACHGECPKHRFVRTVDGEPGLNYLCPAYKRFFTHIAPHMRTMVDLLRVGRAPAEIMRLIAASERTPQRAAGRNDPCPCGSGRKYKACCLRGGL